MPALPSLAICWLRLCAVLARVPTLRTDFAHDGASFRGSIGRLAPAYRCRPDLVAVSTKTSPRQQLHRLYFDSLVHDAEALRYLIRLAGVERIALGTDYPFPLGEAHPGALIESLTELTAAQRERLLAGTAREFLGLSR